MEGSDRDFGIGGASLDQLPAVLAALIGLELMPGRARVHHGTRGARHATTSVNPNFVNGDCRVGRSESQADPPTVSLSSSAGDKVVCTPSHPTPRRIGAKPHTHLVLLLSGLGTR